MSFPGHPLMLQRGTMANDRPPVQGVVGRDSGDIRLTVCDDTRQDTIQPEVEAKTLDGVTFYSDESSAYNRVEASGRPHGTVCHSRSESVWRSMWPCLSGRTISSALPITSCES